MEPRVDTAGQDALREVWMSTGEYIISWLKYSADKKVDAGIGAMELVGGRDGDEGVAGA